jgi:4-hydroxy-tetrahydrodipicolinate synthase
MVTPFTSQGEVDYAQARRLALALVESGSNGVVVTGTTGESPTLFDAERIRLWREVKEAVGDRAAVIAGSGTNGTGESISLSKEAEQAGADALLLVVPYYNKPVQEGLFRHFEAIAASTSLPCIPYNVPSRTIVNMTAETTLQLAQIPNIAGIKEASGDLHQIAQIVEHAPSGFHVWSGNDDDTFAVMSVGGYGIVSVAAHLVGLQIKGMMSLVLAGDLQGAAREHRRLLPLFKGIFVASNPIPIKYCVNRAGFDVGPLRLPLTNADEKTAAFLDGLLAQYTIDLPLTVAA